jgi:hypothetical protein
MGVAIPADKIRIDPNGCWIWLGYIDPEGYGRHAQGYAHRRSYEAANGPIPKGMHTDHLCRVKACVNPAHLEVVTPKENFLRGFGACAQNARKTHCKRGHVFDAANTYYPPSGGRSCRTCVRDLNREYARARARATKAVA